jgi:hypothetical protein
MNCNMNSVKLYSYRLGDLFYGLLGSYADVTSLIKENPNSIGASYAQQSSKNMDTFVKIVQLYMKKYQNEFPIDIEMSTVIHLRLGDVVAGNTWHERIKRPLSINSYSKVKNAFDEKVVYVIGNHFFCKTSSQNYAEGMKPSKLYFCNVIFQMLHYT